jgi:hypothetical protein
MFTLHGLFKSQIIPLVYGLLIGKKASDYDQFFKLIMEEDDFNPESILTDFEAGTIKSVKTLFPHVLHKGNIKFIHDENWIITIYNCVLGCLFHFGQCVWRKIQNFGLQKKYHEDKCFHLNVKMLLALTFVPVVDVIKAFELVSNNLSDDDDNDEFLDYFEKTWIGELKKRGKSINEKDKYLTIIFRYWPQETRISNRTLELL